ncbi:hypothetical protein L2E82_08611 [Cichorium intybus]|uniref:Uncharacterized protein n=1 Tax=Cichorium intybus TaxID=13427 RepID=A0ACB9G7R7_CICIN|nr:hypothetical protein L2E82_08611 [Cichorium intybus]
MITIITIPTVNPRVRFSDEQISAILDEVFRTYDDFIDTDGLLRNYGDGAGDVNRDFEALALEMKPDDDNNNNNTNNELASSMPFEEASTSSVLKERVKSPEPQKQQRTTTWVASPNHDIIFDDTWKLVDDLEILIKRLKTTQMKDSKTKGEHSEVFFDPGWSKELGPSMEMNKQIIS